MRTIDLQPESRENRHISLKPVDTGVWEFCAEPPDNWLLEYMRIGFLDENNTRILFIDPSGGPMLCVGDEIDDIIINSIEHKDGKFLFYAKDKKEI